jgi:hypothetical protein
VRIDADSRSCPCWPVPSKTLSVEHSRLSDAQFGLRPATASSAMTARNYVQRSSEISHGLPARVRPHRPGRRTWSDFSLHKCWGTTSCCLTRPGLHSPATLPETLREVLETNRLLRSGNKSATVPIQLLGIAPYLVVL